MTSFFDIPILPQFYHRFQPSYKNLQEDIRPYKTLLKSILASHNKIRPATLKPQGYFYASFT
jgi:hypothetical protein